VSLRDDLNVCASRLRRFARGLVDGHPAPSKTADDLVQALLQQTLEPGAAIRLSGPDLHLHLFTRLTQMLRQRLASGRLGAEAHAEMESMCSGGPGAAGNAPRLASRRDIFAESLLALTLDEREALLLVVLEGFSYAEAARIVQISRTVFIARLARARAALGDIPAADFIPRPEKVLPPYIRLVK
jgi:RNA polymerase sigma-70 factor (ECF subfamily)